MAAIIRRAFVLSFAVLLAACGVKETMDRAGGEIEQFHAHFDQQDYDAIWRTTSGEFRKITTKEQFERLLVAIRGKLGAVKKSDQQGWQANTTNGVSTVVVSTYTAFEKGDGVETFTFVSEGGGLKLLGYNINSAALIYN